MSNSELSSILEGTRTLRLSPTPCYKYVPLQQEHSIRVLILQPAASASAPLQCELQEVPLSDMPRYEAISYTWGEPVFSKQLHLPSGSLMVTQSLFFALKRFRLENQVRYLWADAICINQSDNAEKAKQVSLMGEIYRNTRNVLVWLGPGDEYTGSVINVLKTLATQSDRYGIQSGADGSIVGAWNGSAQPTGAVKEALENVPIEYDWSGADSFYSLPWFSRMWIVQEIALCPSAHLYCGEFDISWDDLILAAHIEYRSVRRATAMNLRLPYNFHRLKRLEEGIRYSKNRQLGPRLLELLAVFRQSDCFDARDRVYGILSLKNAHDVEIIPNYDDPVTKIYTELAGVMLRNSAASSRNIFYFAGVDHRLAGSKKKSFYENTVYDINSMPSLDIMCRDLPSWVPDWRIPGEYRSFHANQASGHGSRYAAASRFTLNMQIDPIDESLSVVARTIDIIKAGRNLGSAPELQLNAHREQVILMKEFYDGQTGKLKPAAAEAATTVFARTIIADQTQAGTRGFLRDPLSTKDLRDLWLQFASTPHEDESALERFESDGNEGRKAGTKMIKPETGIIKAYSRLYCYRIALLSLLDSRQFIVTNDGLAGLAPAIAQPGDHIVVFAGENTPLVLRPAGRDDRGRNRYYVIGDCFVHGIMYGEFYDVLKDGLWNWMTLI